MKFKNLIFIGFLMIFGCSHISSTEARRQIASESLPAYSKVQSWTSLSLSELKSARSQATNQAENWWMDYREAQLQEKSAPDQSCRIYFQLSQDKKFPLADLSWLRSQSLCSQLDPQFLTHPSLRNPWYKELSIQVRQKFVLTTPSLQDDFDLKLEEARTEDLAHKKEKLLLDTLQLAQQMNSPELVQQAQSQLAQSFPRYLQNPPLNMWLAVAKDQRQVRLFTQAAQTYRNYIRNTSTSLDEKFEGWRGLRSTYKVAQMKTELMAVDSEFSGWLEKQALATPNKTWTKRWHDQLLQQARQLWTEDQSDKAAQLLQKSLQVFKNKYSLDETHFIIARMKEEKAQFEEADLELEKSLAYPESTAGLREKTLWTSAWINYKLKKFPKALTRLEQILQLNLEPSQKYKYLFWKARAQTQLSLPEAQTTYKDLSDQDPLGFYGLLSFRDRQIALPPLELESHDELDLSLSLISEIPSQTGVKLDWLVLAQESKVLEEGLNITLDSIPQQNISEISWIRFLTGFARANRYVRLFSYLPKIKSQTRDHLLKTHPELIFPRPYDEHVIPAAEKNSINPFFIYAIMRQESAYNPEARSPADAMGLLQLLPTLAQELAKENNIPYRIPSDLFKPEINIPLGAIEMKNLFAKYKRNTVLTACGYNASGRAVQGWLKSRFRSDIVEFIEEIPYEETRTYVKLVLRNHVFYQRLAQAQSSLPFPNELMSWPPAPQAYK